MVDRCTFGIKKLKNGLLDYYSFQGWISGQTYVIKSSAAYRKKINYCMNQIFTLEKLYYKNQSK